MIPEYGSSGQFYNLIKLVLDGTISIPENLLLYITLMHPRNSTCTDETFDQIKRINLPKKIEFTKVSLIEQKGHLKWNTLREILLDKANSK
jgi:hypothetical protein